MADSYLSFQEIDNTVLGTLAPATRRYWTAVVVLAGGVMLGAGCWAYQIATGIGVGGQNNPVAWGTYLINFVLKGGPAPDPVCMGDCNPPHDGLVDMEDVLYLMQFLYQGGLPPLATPEIRQPTIMKQQQTMPQAPTPKPLERK